MTGESIPAYVRTRPSSAERWLHCPGSAWVEAAVREEPMAGETAEPPLLTSDEYASEGTTAHAILASELTGRPVEQFLKTEPEVTPCKVPDDDVKAVKHVADIVAGIRDLDGFKMRVEEPLEMHVDQGRYIKGTADVVLYNESRVMVLDYKHGAGQPVRVERNPQLALYGLMALKKFWKKTDCQLTIGVIQPRGRGRGIDLWVCEPEWLVEFSVDVKRAVERVYQPFPEFVPGPWCRPFCRGSKTGACPALLEKALKFAVGASSVDEQELDAAWWLLDWADWTAKIAKKLQANALSFAQRGGEVPGWKLDKKYGNRRWKNPDGIPDVMALLTGADREEFLGPVVPRKPIGLTAADKHPRLQGIELGEHIFKPVNDVLVREAETIDPFDAFEDDEE